ncbi:MAG: hypothetical protein U5L72_14980 [Bacteroidales bacterium]|nr:hypothetical protein [Bacteroidales bacterium]
MIPCQEDEGIDTTFGDLRIRANEWILYAEDNFRHHTPHKDECRDTVVVLQRTGHELSCVPAQGSCLRYLATDELSFKISYSKMAQLSCIC